VRANAKHVACFYVAEVLLALGHLHSLDFVYRDLKPEHVLLAMDGHVMLCDLSTAHRMPGRVGSVAPPAGDMSLIGTPEYLAPEILLSNQCSEAVDFWSSGIFLFELLTGSTPFVSENDVENEVRTLLARVVETADIPSIIEAADVSPEELDLLLRLIERDPEQRLGARPHGYRGVLAHPWFDEMSEDALLRKHVAPPMTLHNLNQGTLDVPEDIVSCHATGAETDIAFTNVELLVDSPQPFAYWSTEPDVQVSVHFAGAATQAVAAQRATPVPTIAAPTAPASPRRDVSLNGGSSESTDASDDEGNMSVSEEEGPVWREATIGRPKTGAATDSDFEAQSPSTVMALRPPQ